MNPGSFLCRLAHSARTPAALAVLRTAALEPASRQSTRTDGAPGAAVQAFSTDSLR
jgi:hypothetical protein